MIGESLFRDKEAIALLKKDHEAVKELFDRFEKTEDRAERKRLVGRAIAELKTHAAIEEELFYPAVRQRLEEQGIVDEAEEEHHTAKMIIAELETMSGDEARYAAKFEVLAENVRHHIKEEEGELFSRASKTDLDMSALGEQMKERKRQLEKTGTPPSPEEALIAGGPKRASRRSGGRPRASAARRKSRRGAKAAAALLAAGLGAVAARAQTGSAAGQATTPTTSDTPPGQTGQTTPGKLSTPLNGINPAPVPGISTAAPLTPNTGGLNTGPLTSPNAPRPPGGQMGFGSGLGQMGFDTGQARGSSDNNMNGAIMGDAQLRQTLRSQILQGQPATGGVTNLTIDAANGRLTVGGVVHTQQEKQAIEAKAAALVGPGNVDDRIIVR